MLKRTKKKIMDSILWILGLTVVMLLIIEILKTLN